MIVLTNLVHLMGRILVPGGKGSHFAAMFNSELNKQTNKKPQQIWDLMNRLFVFESQLYH